MRLHSHVPAHGAGARERGAAEHTAVRRDDRPDRLGGERLRVEERPVLVEPAEGDDALALPASGSGSGGGGNGQHTKHP